MEVTEAGPNRALEIGHGVEQAIVGRPSPQQLIQQKIITDIGALPSGLVPPSPSLGYQRTPRMVDVLKDEFITEVGCGFAHTVALTKSGTLFVIKLTVYLTHPAFISLMHAGRCE